MPSAAPEKRSAPVRVRGFGRLPSNPHSRRRRLRETRVEGSKGFHRKRHASLGVSSGEKIVRLLHRVRRVSAKTRERPVQQDDDDDEGEDGRGRGGVIRRRRVVDAPVRALRGLEALLVHTGFCPALRASIFSGSGGKVEAGRRQVRDGRGRGRGRHLHSVRLAKRVAPSPTTPPPPGRTSSSSVFRGAPPPFPPRARRALRVAGFVRPASRARRSARAAGSREVSSTSRGVSSSASERRSPRDLCSFVDTLAPGRGRESSRATRGTPLSSSFGTAFASRARRRPRAHRGRPTSARSPRSSYLASERACRSSSAACCVLAGVNLQG